MAASTHESTVARVTPGAMIGCLAVAALLRLPGLRAQSLWLDEIYSIKISTWSLQTILSVQDGHPPLYTLLLKLLLLWSPSDVAGRVVSARAGIASVGLPLVLGTRLWDRRTGILAALLLAISPLHVWYSREGRMYALVVLASILSTLCLEGFLRRRRIGSL